MVFTSGKNYAKILQIVIASLLSIIRNIINMVYTTVKKLYPGCALTQQQIAEQLGVSQSYVSHMLKGRRRKTPALIRYIEQLNDSTGDKQNGN